MQYLRDACAMSVLRVRCERGLFMGGGGGGGRGRGRAYKRRPSYSTHSCVEYSDNDVLGPSGLDVSFFGDLLPRKERRACEAELLGNKTTRFNIFRSVRSLRAVSQFVSAVLPKIICPILSVVTVTRNAIAGAPSL